MAIRLGERAPGFELPGTDGEPHSLSGEDEAAATLVYWTCNHCPYALAWHERMLDVARDYADRGVRTLAINSNDAERYPADSYEAMVERVEREGGWPHPYLHDETQDVARAWGAAKTPHLFVLDGEGVLRYRGAPDADYDDDSQGAVWVREALDSVLAGHEPARPETEPVGCGVKWKS